MDCKLQIKGGLIFNKCSSKQGGQMLIIIRKYDFFGGNQGQPFATPLS